MMTFNNINKEMTNKEAIEYFEYFIELENDPNPAIVKAIQALKNIEEIKEILSKKEHLEFEGDELTLKDGNSRKLMEIKKVIKGE